MSNEAGPYRKPKTEEKLIKDNIPYFLWLDQGYETASQLAEKLEITRAGATKQLKKFWNKSFLTRKKNTSDPSDKCYHYKIEPGVHIHIKQLIEEHLEGEKTGRRKIPHVNIVREPRIEDIAEEMGEHICPECGESLRPVDRYCPNCGVEFEEESEEDTEGQVIAEGERTEEEEGEIEDKKPKIDIDAGFKRLDSKSFPHRDTNTHYPLDLEQYVVRLNNIGNSKAVSVKLFCEYKDSSNITLSIDEIDIGILNTKKSIIKIFFFPVSRRSIFESGKLILTVRYEHKTIGRKYESKREFDIITNSDAALVLDQDFSNYNILQPMGL